MAGLVLLVLNVHLIHFRGRWTWGWKARPALRGTVIETQDWQLNDFFEHEDITAILFQRGFDHVLGLPEAPPERPAGEPQPMPRRVLTDRSQRPAPQVTPPPRGNPLPMAR